MTVQLVSSNSTKKRVGPKIVKYLPISEIVCTKGHWEVLRESDAMIIELQKKLVIAAIYRWNGPIADSRGLFIPSVYVGIPNRDGIFTESALLGEAARRGVGSAVCGVYLRHFVTEQFVKFFAHAISHAGIKSLYFKDGRLTENAVIIFKDNGIKVTKVDV